MEKKGEANVLKVTDENFNELISKPGTIVVDFWAPWCMPCKMLGPVIESLAKKYSGSVVFGKMNIDENPDTPAKFNVMSIPTLIVFKDGVRVGEMLGLMSEGDIEDKITKATG